MKLNTYMKLKERIRDFLHDEKLKRKLYVIIFESDTPAGKLFDVVLIGCILVSVLLVIIESLKSIPSYLTTPFVIMEYLFTAFFTFEYLTRIYCSPRPRKYIFSFFGIVDLLATLPLYIGLRALYHVHQRSDRSHQNDDEQEKDGYLLAAFAQGGE